MEKYNIKVSNTDIRIYINDLLHLMIEKKEFVGIQSWIAPSTKQEIEEKGLREFKYVIEFTMKTQVITCEYSLREKWESILKLLDQKI